MKKIIFILLIIIVFYQCGGRRNEIKIKGTPLAPGGAIPAPTGVQASDGQWFCVDIQWNLVNEAIDYFIYRAQSPDGSYSQLNDQGIGGTGTETNFNFGFYSDNSALSGVTYYYKVKAHSFQYGYSYFSDYDSGYRL